jgi:DNA-directed RNA polymerase specialized sigma subunit
MPDLKELFSFPIASERKRGTTPSTAHPRRQGKKKKDAPRLVQQSLTFRETLRALCHLYKKEHDPRRKEEIVEKALALLRRTAGHLRFRLPAHIDVRELEGWGVPGLLQAIESYDHHSPASFETHAQARIRGSILDTIRGLDTVTRASRNKAEAVNKNETPSVTV